jgi:hypothetical protein
MEIISREEAKAQGKKFFFTGEDCKRGHKDYRYVSTSQCASCQKLHKKRYGAMGKDKEYYEKNKKELSIKAKEYRERNRKAISATKKLYAQANRDRIKAYKKQYHELNREYICEKSRKYYEENKEVIASKSIEYRQRTKDRKAAYDRMFSQQNRHYRNMLKGANRAKRIQRFVEWDKELTEFVVQEAYDLCERREQLTRVKWHVDHVIPLCGKNVSGLHVWNNLAVIPAAINLSKNNKYVIQ